MSVRTFFSFLSSLLVGSVLLGHGVGRSSLQIDVSEAGLAVEFRLPVEDLEAWAVVSEEEFLGFELGRSYVLSVAARTRLAEEFRILDESFSPLSLVEATVSLEEAKRLSEAVAVVRAGVSLANPLERLSIWFPTGIDHEGGLFSADLTLTQAGREVLSQVYVGPVFPATCSLAEGSPVGVVEREANGFLTVNAESGSARLVLFAPLSLWGEKGEAFRRLSDAERARELVALVRLAGDGQQISVSKWRSRLFLAHPSLFLRGEEPSRRTPDESILLSLELTYELGDLPAELAVELSAGEVELPRLLLGTFVGNSPRSFGILEVGKPWMWEIEALGN